MSLVLQARLERGTFARDVAVSVAHEVLGVIGANGSGKTSMLRVIAGLDRLTKGHLTLGEVTWDNPDTNHFVVPEQRKVGMVFHRYWRMSLFHCAEPDNRSPMHKWPPGQCSRTLIATT
jgi:ABC-type sulfate/molybdate transport systems ATPase subunit